MKEPRVITRRDFLRGTAGVALTVAFNSGISATAQAEQKAKVVLIRNAEVLTVGGKVHGEILRNMLDEALKALLAESEPLQAWRRLVKGSDVVGIKSNAWYKMPTPKELEDIIRVHDLLRRKMFVLPNPRTSMIFDLDSTVLPVFGWKIEEARLFYGKVLRIDPENVRAKLKMDDLGEKTAGSDFAAGADRIARLGHLHLDPLPARAHLPQPRGQGALPLLLPADV